MIEVLSSDRDLATIGPEWDALWRRSASASPFQSPHWLLPWWNAFGTGHPRVAIGRVGRQLAGILPLYILPEERKLLPIGAGSTDYLDCLGASDGLLDATLRNLDVDQVVCCDLIDVPPVSPLIQSSVEKWDAVWQESVSCPVLTLSNISKLARRKLRMNRNRAERAGGWAMETANADTLQHHLNHLIRFHQDRWTARGEAGAMADQKIRKFWQMAAPGLLASGLLRLNSLRIGGEISAVVAALLSSDGIHFYLGGFDETHSFCSPGTLLVGAMLEEAAAEGRLEAHFLRGREAYKYAWGAEDRWNWMGRLTPK